MLFRYDLTYSLNHNAVSLYSSLLKTFSNNLYMSDKVESVKVVSDRLCQVKRSFRAWEMNNEECTA